MRTDMLFECRLFKAPVENDPYAPCGKAPPMRVQEKDFFSRARMSGPRRTDPHIIPYCRQCMVADRNVSLPGAFTEKTEHTAKKIQMIDIDIDEFLNPGPA